MPDIKQSALKAEAALSQFLVDANTHLYTEERDTLERALDIIRKVRKT